MNTKETKRRTRHPAKATRKQAPAKTERKNRTTVNRQRSVSRRRVVRAPREDIPKVVYTAPKPLRRSRLILRLVSMVAVVVAVLGCLSVFFKVDTIMVAGPEQYSAWMVREASGVEEGDSLLTIGRAKVAGRIKQALPYVDQVKVTIRLPGTVEIEITEFPVSYAIQSNVGSWWLMTSDGTVHGEITAADATALTRIFGIQLQDPRAESAANAALQTAEDGAVESQESADARLDAALQILDALEANNIIGEVISLDVSSIENITMQYSQLLSVRLGDSRRLDYKITYMAAAVRQLDEYQNGELDLSFEYSDSALFSPGS